MTAMPPLPALVAIFAFDASNQLAVRKLGSKAGLPFTGAAMNPARALASAVAAIDFSSLWLCACGSLAGGAVAGLVGRWFLAEGSADAGRRG